MNFNMNTKIIRGNSHTDHRGTVRFVNDFSFEGIRRFYTISHPDTNTIRAWQGHQYETKYFFITKGSFLIHWIEIDNWQQPSRDLSINTLIISDKQTEILVIMPGHVTGFKALEPESTMILFSNKTLEESQNDDYRFPLEYWKFDNTL
jgi:dTDP-4-dehydrorhamnose 3,5-epimerase-like enzyme